MARLDIQGSLKTAPPESVPQIDLGAVFKEMGALSLKSQEVAEAIRDGLNRLRDEIARNHVLGLVQPSVEHADVLTDGTVATLDDQGAPEIVQAPPDALTSIAGLARVASRMNDLEAEIAQRSREMNRALIQGLRDILAHAKRIDEQNGTSSAGGSN